MLKKFLVLKSIPKSQDLALLVLRLSVGVPMFMMHGLDKVVKFSEMSQRFADPIGIGPMPSLVLAILAEVVCTVFIVLGFATRWSALVLSINMMVIWGIVQNFKFESAGNELAVMYLGGALTLLFAGAGKFSIDRKLEGK